MEDYSGGETNPQLGWFIAHTALIQCPCDPLGLVPKRLVAETDLFRGRFEGLMIVRTEQQKLSNIFKQF